MSRIRSGRASERRLIHTGIEELLPGGVIEGPYGSLFIHERLYTDLGEEPGPVLERFDALCRLAAGPCPASEEPVLRRKRSNGHSVSSGRRPGRSEGGIDRNRDGLNGDDRHRSRLNGNGPALNWNGPGLNGNGPQADGTRFGYAHDDDIPDDGNAYDPSLEPRVVYDPEPARFIQPFLPTMEAQVEWPERGLFRRFGYRKMLFLDLETCGLSGCPVFLAGVALIGEGDVVLRQLFARDYAEERALLAELGRLMDEADFLVTFNGKTFDVPFLRDRAVHHRMERSFSIPHLDLVWMVRRRWKRQLPDCKLKTLEWRVLRRRRAGDVWGYEIPGLYHDYVQNGQPHRLIPVFHHNMLDVVAMVELIPAVFDPETTVY